MEITAIETRAYEQMREQLAALKVDIGVLSAKLGMKSGQNKQSVQSVQNRQCRQSTQSTQSTQCTQSGQCTQCTQSVQQTQSQNGMSSEAQ